MIQESGNTSSSIRAFTLIELLVVIAIISLLSSVVLSSLSNARASARDARRKQDLNQMRTAINMFFNEFGEMPDNYDPGWGACSDADNADAYRQSMQELVDAGFLPSIPDEEGDLRYCYYDYGPDHPAGAIVVTRLETIEPTSEAPLGSCRPFTSNWCSYTREQRDYCVCNQY